MSRHVVLVEPYYGGSHRVWVDTYVRYSRHYISKLILPAQNWKWRMRGGAITMARLLRESQWQPDVFLVSDMLDVALFRALIAPEYAQIPVALYFHENQLTYPQNKRQQHGIQYGFINYAGALVADAVWFNSEYHREDFLQAAWRMLRHAWDYSEEGSLETVRAKSEVLAPVMDLSRFDAYQSERKTAAPVILWNHRWEDDKNPQAFFEALYALQAEGFDFQVILAGENFQKNPVLFEAAKDRLGSRILHYGYAETFAEYAALLWHADYVVSTAEHDFFGMAVVEALYCGCVPVLANRLNYPYLIPESQHEACLFPRGKLVSLLRRHLRGQIQVDKNALRHHLTQFERDTLVKKYDDALEVPVT